MAGDGAPPQFSTLEAALATLVVIGLTLAIAACVHALVEKPAREASRRIATGRGARLAPAAG